MAVRFNTSGQRYTLSTGLGSRNTLSVSCWLKFSEAKSWWSTVWEFGNVNSVFTIVNDGGNYLAVIVGFPDSFNRTPLRPVSVGTWYYVGASYDRPNSLLTVVSRAENESTFIVNTVPVNSNFPAGTFRIGEGVKEYTWYLNGCIAGLKIWTPGFTQAELEAEASQLDPVRTADLFAYYRFDGPSQTDDSGNGRTLSGGSGTTQEPGPSFSLPPVEVDVAEDGTAADTLAVSASTSLADAGAAADSLATGRLIDIADAAEGDVLLATGATADLSDEGSGVESIDRGVPVSLDESASASSKLLVSAASHVVEESAASEALVIAASAGLIEAGTAHDALLTSPVTLKHLTDSGTAADSVSAISVVQRSLAVGWPRRFWSAGSPRSGFSAGEPRRAWHAGSPRYGGITLEALSSLSREFLFIPVKGPTGVERVQVAFTNPTAEPVESDWHDAMWANIRAGGADAKILVGPDGGVELVDGTYRAWVRVTTAVERPVLPSGLVPVV